MNLEAVGELLYRWSPVVIGSVYLVGLFLWRRAYRRLFDQVTGTAQIALELLDLMEQSRDPGREVHERLARVLEAGLIKSEGPPDPAGRRVAAMALAAAHMEAIRRANLTLVPADPPED